MLTKRLKSLISHKPRKAKWFGVIVAESTNMFAEPTPNTLTQGTFKEMTKAELLIWNGNSCLLARASMLVYLASRICLNETNEGEPAPVNKLNGSKWASVHCYSEISIVLV